MYLDSQTGAYVQREDQGTGVPLFTKPLGGLSWNGRSGRAYAHVVYSLIGCPAPSSASYLLVHRDTSGTALPLAVGRTSSRHASLNLAGIRHTGATLGANEVHLLEGGSAQADAAAHDLAEGLGLPLSGLAEVRAA